jgi:hypothetical protein
MHRENASGLEAVAPPGVDAGPPHAAATRATLSMTTIRAVFLTRAPEDTHS